jgi:hypothetical protein
MKIKDAETRWVGAEGYLACDRKCTLNSNKWDDYKTCKLNC